MGPQIDMKKTKDVTVKVRMSSEDKRRLQRYAKAKQISLSYAVRQGVDLYMESYK